MREQPWIGKPVTDCVFILAPPFLCLGIIVLFPAWFQNNSTMSTAGWVILVLFVDVAHVYSTLYRTYFDPVHFRKQKTLLLGIPLLAFTAGVLLYAVDSFWFWRLLAYVAIFHFVRQQYGFMRMYSRRENRKSWQAKLDTATVYYAALYPLLFWHLSGPRNFNWFIPDDLLYFRGELLLSIATGLYYLVVAVYVCKEIYNGTKHRYVNIPRLLVIAGTLVSWYFGIVYFNGDMAFTLLNVVSHGIPYMALVWIYGKKNYTRSGRGTRFLRIVFSRYGWLLFTALLFLFAFIEEGFWDWAVWQERGEVFGFSRLSPPKVPKEWMAFLVPLLALPQVTHYILDGFIWKIRDGEFRWKNEQTNTNAC